ncbi:WD repeat-containing protein 89-like protein [Diplonema papillatum]|nr:WD repeat-containing protein 89-like protein [Diplonema papillatum]|eukprot:gene16663-25568_t
MLKLQHRVKAAYEAEEYILDGAVSRDVIAATNSLKTIKTYKTDSLVFSGELKGHHDVIRDVRFNKRDPNVVVTCGESSHFQWDLRTGRGTKLALPPSWSRSDFLSIDGSSDGIRYAVAEGSDIVIYDVRNLSESLSRMEYLTPADAVNRIRWHDTQENVLTVGSEMGYVVVIDASLDAEDDACRFVFNIEQPINTLTYKNDAVIATTAVETVFAANYDTGDVVAKHERPSDFMYCIGPVYDVMLWGINGEGYESRTGEILSAPLGCHEGIESWPVTRGGHQDVVRFAHAPLDGSSQTTLFTGGEDGFICAWGASTLRTGLPTPSRSGASKEMLRSEIAAPEEMLEFVSVTDKMPPPGDFGDLTYTGECEVTVSPLRQHKARKSGAKFGKAPY